MLCCFPRKITVPLYPDLLKAITGTPFTTEDLDLIGLRILTQERLFNIREGLGRKDDTLPERLLNEPLPDGPNKGSTVPLETLKDEAYAALGWDLETGVPKQKLLNKLGIKS